MVNRESHASARSPLSNEELRLMDAWWCACNYLAVGMIYLRANPLLREPLKPEHVKHRLLGHWGTSPALSFVAYARSEGRDRAEIVNWVWPA